MNPNQERARILIDQDRWPEAEQELGRALAEDPEDGWNYYLLSIVKSNRAEDEEALRLAQQALLKEPDNLTFHLGLAWRKYSVGDSAGARSGAQAVLAQDPGYPAVYALLSVLELDQRNWRAALDWADRGLALDPEHAHCLQLRTMALNHLADSDEAESAALHAVSLDPDSDFAHTALGWTHLRNGNYAGADLAFREALRLNPNNDGAREGLAEVLKAKFWPYRLWHKYAFWVASLTKGRYWIFFLAVYFAQRLLRFISKEFPDYRWLSAPIALALTLLVFGTWFAEPVANLILRLHPYGRLLQSKQQRRASTVFGALFASAIVLAIVAMLLSFVWIYPAVAFLLIGLMWEPVLSAPRYAWRKGPRYLVIAASFAAAVSFLSATIQVESTSLLCATAVFLAFIAFGWWNAAIGASRDGRDE
jgi:tetratricopeptide (TPR) repeat protein